MRLRTFAAVAFVFSASIAARADLIGSSVTATVHYPNQSTIYSSAGPVVVGTGIEFAANSITGYQESVDISGNQIIIGTGTTPTGHTVSAYNGLYFDFTGAPNITSVTLDASSTVTPLSFAFTGTEVSVNLSGVASNANTNLILDVGTTPVSVTPEPSGLALLGTGLLGVVGVMRKRFA